MRIAPNSQFLALFHPHPRFNFSIFLIILHVILTEYVYVFGSFSSSNPSHLQHFTSEMLLTLFECYKIDMRTKYAMINIFGLHGNLIKLMLMCVCLVGGGGGGANTWCYDVFYEKQICSPCKISLHFDLMMNI